ncbi:hypothetical protein F4859DRAFT_498881 [Xylaria cf. heliscus]|nr:hypothetical protein F4859DRAFT_498881 [Xylaria cf. heliscus]
MYGLFCLCVPIRFFCFFFLATCEACSLDRAVWQHADSRTNKTRTRTGCCWMDASVAMFAIDVSVARANDTSHAPTHDPTYMAYGYQVLYLQYCTRWVAVFIITQRYSLAQMSKH